MLPERFLGDCVVLRCGDCRDVLATLPENLFDACVTDPPYHLVSVYKRFANEARNEATVGNHAYGRHARGFMGKVWDGGDLAFDPETWRAVYRVLKPGAHVVAFGGSRTYGRLQVAIEDAGFEVRDTIAWLYGSGFPKSHDVSKGIDKAAGALSHQSKRFNHAGGGFPSNGGSPFRSDHPDYQHYEGRTDAARQWAGWGTALKPSHEDLVIAQKPYDLRWLADTLAHTLFGFICQLPSLANAAESRSPSSRSVFDAAFGSAQWNAVLKCNTPAALFDLMATLPSASAIPSSLNIALSWLATLVEVSASASTFTTETATGLIIDLQTLSYLLSRTTADCIIRAAIRPSGAASNADPVVAIFSAVQIRLHVIHSLSAHGIASARDVISCPAEAANFDPECELICLARKPLSEPTVAANVLRWGTGAINIDGCRIEGAPRTTHAGGNIRTAVNNPFLGSKAADYRTGTGLRPGEDAMEIGISRAGPFGRWPANVAHDGSSEVLAQFPETAPSFQGTRSNTALGRMNDDGWEPQPRERNAGVGDSGSAARFFYTSKADPDDRIGSKHPTVKPLDLMQWLVRLVCARGGCVLDPFAGTGTTAEAAWREGMRCDLIEAEAEYCDDIRRRMALALAGPDERTRESVKARGLPRDDGPLFDWKPYDAADDMRRSLEDCYAAVRERVAQGGEEWPKK